MDQAQLRLPMGDQSQAMTSAEVDELRRDVIFSLGEDAAVAAEADAKARVRLRHASHRRDTWQREMATIRPQLGMLLSDFASGSDITPEKIEPIIELVETGTRSADLFRLATLLWSVPVSRGYGRRMRFLIRDGFNEKVLGVLALGDPVFNLGARDRWIGWSADDRRDRLVNVMDAFVVGAVPPYSYLLGGKLVFSLTASAEIAAMFAERYSSSTGIISGRRKTPSLALVTVTSALGRSSLYNRLRLRDPLTPSRFLMNLMPIGWTSGYGHFQIGDQLFARLRRLLISRGHTYANGHQFGDGPNWRMRVTRVALEELQLRADLQRHGIHRQIFVLPLMDNVREYLTGREAEPEVGGRPSATTIAAAALQRWVVPRSRRDERYKHFRKEELEQLLSQPPTDGTFSSAPPSLHPGVGR